ncbi:CLUMA_CG005228, isoform A [Clunio marinus]|uniref:CLUMA_CG005228, isoform A n=1 Tax=Clunio marinus TaxID=568069 RepID=A0A1J1HYG4_9DIPT|nr:CLUMA_CG005228, isoform A [Clunio marinus]
MLLACQQKHSILVCKLLDKKSIPRGFENVISIQHHFLPLLVHIIYLISLSLMSVLSKQINNLLLRNSQSLQGDCPQQQIEFSGFISDYLTSLPSLHYN